MKMISVRTRELSRVLACLLVTSVVVMFVFAGCKKKKTDPVDEPYCGNGIIEEGEECDGDNLGGMTCDDLEGFVGGTLSCTDTCTFDTTECEPEEILPDEKAKVTIIHTSDLHHHASGYGPFADYTPLDTTDNDIVTGGFARIAGKVNEIRTEQALDDIPVMLFDAGDYFMGTIYDLTIEDPIAFKFFELLGYDAVTIGNHELDWGPAGFAMLLNNALGETPGESNFNVPIVATNMITDPDDPGDDAIEDFIAAGVITDKYIYDLPNGLTVGVLGNLGKDAHELMGLHHPLDFVHDDVFWQERVDDLRENEGVDLVLIMSHGGIYGDGSGNDADLAMDVDGIDVIMSGHYHTATETAFEINNTLIYSPGSYGQYISRLDLTYNLTQGEIDEWDFELITIDDTVMGDPVMDAVVEAYHDALDAHLMPALGLGVASPIVEVPFDLPSPGRTEIGETPLGALTSDALRFVATAIAMTEDPTDYTPYTVGIVPYGTIRVGLYTGTRGYATFADIYNVMPIGMTPDTDDANRSATGWPLVSAYLTGAEIKNVAEVPVTLAPTLRMLTAFLGLSGIRVEYDPTGGALPPNRVRHIYICGNPLVDPFSMNCPDEMDLDPTNDTLYRVVTDLYTIMLMGIIDGVGLVIEPKHADGTLVDISDMDDLMSIRVDGMPHVPGIQEVKVWMALLQFVTTEAVFPSTDDGQYPPLGEIPSVYDVDGDFEPRLIEIAD